MNKTLLFSILIFSLVILPACKSEKSNMAEQWKETELTFESTQTYQNPYVDIEFYAEFNHENGTRLIRPGFWDGDNTWRIRFASPEASGGWKYKTVCSNENDDGLHGHEGRLTATPYNGNNTLIKNGFLRMSEGNRNVIHANGNPFLLVGDTPWALPWRGTYETVTTYAKNRQEHGFNAALLMSLMPDRGVEGPRSRTEPQGFAVAFEDLKDGHINQINIEYYQYMDSLMNILVNHGIVPVYQPVFHGFGWKGKNLLGWDMDADEYARYCKYLVARYGAKPAMWLVGADSDGRNTGIKEGGETVEQWDAYNQPTGLHYSPFDDYVPDWWDRTDNYVPHYNKTHQDAAWLDFQWAQTGHNAKHLTHKVERMYENKPVKATANGEPTYEGIANPENASGWWQGHEAWLQFTSGGTMGVVYGAGGLWNWKLFPEEKGWPDWANSNVSWKEAIELPGARYVGYFAKALNGLNITDIEKHPELAGGSLCLARPGELYIVYLPEGGEVQLQKLAKGMTFQWFDPKTGEFYEEGTTEGEKQSFDADTNEPAVLIVAT